MSDAVESVGVTFLNKTCAFKTCVADTLEGFIITMSLTFIEMVAQYVMFLHFAQELGGRTPGNIRLILIYFWKHVFLFLLNL